MAKFKAGDVIVWLAEPTQRRVVISVGDSSYEVRDPRDENTETWRVWAPDYDEMCRLLTPLEKMLE